jgi:CRISPR-associated endoribonuclease Cas6
LGICGRIHTGETARGGRESLISLRFHVTSPFSGEIGFSGVPLRAAFLNLLREYDKELSGNVHGSGGVRAYSIDPFPCDRNFSTHFEEGHEYGFSVHLFRPSAFQDLIRTIAMKRDTGLRIHHHMFSTRRIEFIRRDPTSLMTEWTDSVDESCNRPIQIRFDFFTPTQLSNYGSDKAFLLPTPAKVFSGLLRVWNTMEDATKLEQTSGYYDWIENHVYVSGHYLRTVKISMGRKRSVVGFIGNVVYSVEPDYTPLFKMTLGLARYAEICNVGKNRSAGFGKVGVQIRNPEIRKGTDLNRRGREDVFTAGRNQEKIASTLSEKI